MGTDVASCWLMSEWAGLISAHLSLGLDELHGNLVHKGKKATLWKEDCHRVHYETPISFLVGGQLMKLKGRILIIIQIRRKLISSYFMTCLGVEHCLLGFTANL